MFRLSVDHYFHIGAAHYASGKPCQDYALSGFAGEAAYAIVSDGCSSGGHTDVGSRILALSTSQAISDHFKVWGSEPILKAIVSIESRQQQNLTSARALLGVSQDDLLATCVYAYITPFGGFVSMQGDGVIALKYRDGSVLMYRYEWADNTPFYPSYGDGRIEAFVAAHGGDINAERLTRETVLRKSDGIYHEVGVERFSVRDGLGGSVISLDPEEMNDLEFAAVFSDGVSQIENVDWKDAVAALLSFKSTTGEFAKRRMIREIKDRQKTGKGPIDDIACAIIRIAKEE